MYIRIMEAVLTDPKTQPLWESQRLVNQAQAQQLRLLVGYVESFLRETEVTDPHLMRTARGRATAECAAIMHAAEAMGSGEGHVASQYHQARFAREFLPAVWTATRAGEIPVRSLIRVVSAAERLVLPVSRERLDRAAADYAVTHRPVQLNAWLNRFVSRVEPELHAQRCSLGQSERRVWLEHLEDGLSILHAMLPTLTAEAIRKRLVDVARSPKRSVPYDPCVERPDARNSMSTVSALGVARIGYSDRADADRTQVLDLADWVRLPSSEDLQPWDPGTDSLGSRDSVYTAVGLSHLESLPHGRHPGNVSSATSRDTGDARTQGQREADLLSHWLLTGETDSVTPINAEVGLIISAESLLGSWDEFTDSEDVSGTAKGAGTHSGSAPEQPAISRDRRHAYPAEMIRRIVQADEHRITWIQLPDRTAPMDSLSPPDEGLERVYQSRFVPKRLRQLIEFRDGTCQAPGCMVAAEHCDIDHRIPWPRGETTASNLWALCRKHHRLKTAGFLDVPARADAGRSA